MCSLKRVVAAALLACSSPVLGEHPEYAHMQRQGFAALFAQRNNPDSILTALRRYLSDEPLRRGTIEKNRAYTAAHEDEHTQMDLLLKMILTRLDRPVKIAAGESAFAPAVQSAA